jgi:hypothetical protein
MVNHNLQLEHKMRNLPTKPGIYFWTEYNRNVVIDRAVAFNWKRPRKVTTVKSLCVLPFSGFPYPIKLTAKMAGDFYVAQKELL